MPELNTMNTSSRAALALGLAASLAACGSQENAGNAGAPASPPPASQTPPPATDADVVPAAWMGRWNGPEGTYIDIAGTEGQYRVTIANLDGPREFPAAVTNGVLSFERDGVRETVRATDGAATGMKWLMDKKDCLTVKSGEGYCKDWGPGNP